MIPLFFNESSVHEGRVEAAVVPSRGKKNQKRQYEKKVHVRVFVH